MQLTFTWPYTCPIPSYGHGWLHALLPGLSQHLVCSCRKFANSHCLTFGFPRKAVTISVQAAQQHSVCSCWIHGTSSMTGPAAAPAAAFALAGGSIAIPCVTRSGMASLSERRDLRE